MLKTRTYIVYRTGSNAANQPMTTEPVPVFVSEARSAQEAIADALKEGITCYANQRLTARPAGRCSQNDYRLASEAVEERMAWYEAITDR